MAELFKFRCYGCQKLIGAPPSKFGKVVHCPRCGVELIVPWPETEGEGPGEPEPDADSFRPEDLGLNLELAPERMVRPEAPSARPLELGEPNPIAFLEQVAASEAPESPEPEAQDEPAASQNEPTEEPVLPEPEEEPLVPRRRGQRPFYANEPTFRARDVVLPRTAAVAWAMFGLFGLAFAFTAGLMIGHYLWR